MIDRRQLAKTALAASATLTLPWTSSARAVEVNEDGLHVQPWFLESFLDLKDDLEEAAADNKKLAVIFEQRGCPYCREMHEVNFKKEQILTFVKEHFNILQLNLWGSRKVTDFDGTEYEERNLARKWAVNFTPTIVFFPSKIEEGKAGKELEVARMPGYFKPFHFLSMFEFVKEDTYEKMGFQKFLQEKFADLQAKGIKPDVW